LGKGKSFSREVIFALLVDHFRVYRGDNGVSGAVAAPVGDPGAGPTLRSKRINRGRKTDT
jgi:hypothetical protein